MFVVEVGYHGETEEVCVNQGKPTGMKEVETGYGLRRWERDLLSEPRESTEREENYDK